MRLLKSMMFVGMLMLLSSVALAQCTTIQDGTLKDVNGNPISTAYDQFGYNYQAHMFNGRYCDVDRVIGGNYCDVDLVMKWNDAWLSNQDCTGDSKLDRYYGFSSYIGSGSWETNHQQGTGDCGNGKSKHWSYFVKIVAAPDDAYQQDGIWYDVNGVEIGEVIWGAFAIIQQVYNDPCEGTHGKLYVSPKSPGFGVYKPDTDTPSHEE